MKLDNKRIGLICLAIAFVVVVVLYVLCLTGCSTVHGLGTDLHHLSEQASSALERDDDN